jgi:glycosyltransferase involved in cell wall biosynthesis
MHTDETSSSRIAVVGLTYPYRGGISHYSSLFVRALRKKYEVTFLTLCRQYPKLLFPGVSQFDFSDHTLEEEGEAMVDSMNPLSWIRTARRLNREQPALIIFQWWHPFFSFAFGSIVWLLSKPLQARVCFLCHNVLPHESNPLQTLLTKFAYWKVNSFIVHSTQDRQQLEAFRPGAVIKQGCHPTYSEFASLSSISRSEARKELGLSDDAKVVLFFGLVRKYKGLKYLIEAMALLPDSLNCHLLVAGEFYDDKQPYLSSIAARGLEEKVSVVDDYIPNEQVAMYFRAANVVALPYVSATQSGIVQIAFGLDTPVITTNVGGLPEAVDDGLTGHIVESENAEQLADAIVRYFENASEQPFQAAIRQQTERFDWNQEISKVEELLGDVQC